MNEVWRDKVKTVTRRDSKIALTPGYIAKR